MKKLLASLSVIALLAWYMPVQADIYGSSSLDSWFTLDSNNISGTTVTDGSGNANTGTLHGTETLTSGKMGQALVFDGSTNYIKVPQSASLSLNNSYTVTAWFKDNGSPNNGILFSRRSNTFSNAETRLSVQCGQTCVRWDIGNSVGSESAVNSVVNAVDGKWHFIVGVVNYNTNIILYVDTAAPVVGSAIGGTLSDTTAGDFWGTNTDYGSPFLKGTLDDVRFYSRALSASDVAQLYYQSFNAHAAF